MKNMLRRLKSIEVDRRAKRFLAAWLGICIVLELLMSGVAPLGSFAGSEGMLPVHEIKIPEKKIRNALKNGDSFWDSEDVNLRIPYKDEERREAAIEKVEELLLGMNVVTQEGGSNWSAIVAAYTNDDTDKEDFTIDQVMLIGLNGSKTENCIFKLKITNAEGIVIRSMTVTGYSMDGSSGFAATPSEATPSEATSSEAVSSEATPSETVISDGVAVVTATAERAKNKTVELKATASDAEEEGGDTKDGLKATASDAASEEADESSERYGYEEDYTLQMSEEEIAGVVEYRKTISLFAAASPQEENRMAEAAQSSARAPMLIARTETIVTASAYAGEDGSQGNIVTVDVTAPRKIVEAGNTTTFFEFSGRYSKVDNKLPETAYAMVSFAATDPDGNEYTRLGEPNPSAPSADDLGEVNEDIGEDWEKVKELLQKRGNTTEGWKVIQITNDSYYFYSAEEGVAILPIKGGGSSSSDISIRLSFQNGVTKDGTKVTAVPSLLNQEEIIEAYKSSGNLGPGQNSDEIIKQKFQYSEPVEVESTADFYWDLVKKSTQTTNLGNLLTGTDVSGEGNILFNIKAKPNYKTNENWNVHYTKAYTVSDKMMFGGFYIDAKDYTVEIKSDTDEAGNVYLTKGDESIKLIDLLITREKDFNKLKAGASADSGDFKKIIRTEPVYENDTPEDGKIVGIKFDYTLENHTLESDTPVDLKLYNGEVNGEGTLSVKFALGAVQKAGLIVFNTKPGGKPTLKNEAYFDAYSNMYEGPDYPSEEGETKKEDGKKTHHSYSSTQLMANEAYPLSKTAYHYQKENGTLVEAKEENKIFEPEGEVYYKIEVTNNGYADDTFSIRDILPDGIDADATDLESLFVAGEEIKKTDDGSWPKTESGKSGQQNYVEWSLKIPARAKAELLIKAKIKGVQELTASNIDTKFVNKAEWYRTSNLNQVLAKDTAEVVVNLNQLTAENIKFNKTLKSADGETLLVGDSVTYELQTRLDESITERQWLTITDNWPGDQINLAQVDGINPEALVILRDGAGEEIARFENTVGYTQAPLLPWHFKKNGIAMDSRDIPNISSVEISTYVSPDKQGIEDEKQGVAVKLNGTLTDGGEIVNNASTSVEGAPGSSATLTALGMSIEKKAYYIGGETAKAGITDANSTQYPVTSYLTFAGGDVICYEVKVKNTGEASAIFPEIKDDFSKLFGDEAKTPELAEATLNKTRASLFYSTDSGSKKNWTAVEAGPDNGIINIKIQDIKPEGLAKGEECVLRFYVKVPAEAVKETTAVYKNTATASLTLGDKPYKITASADISTVPEGEQSVSIDKEVFAVGKIFNRNGSNPNYDQEAYLDGARWNTREIGAGTGYMPDEEILSVAKDDYILYKITITNEGKTPLQIYEVRTGCHRELSMTAFMNLVQLRGYASLSREQTNCI